MNSIHDSQVIQALVRSPALRSHDILSDIPKKVYGVIHRKYFLPEGAGLLAGPGRAPGRSRSRANRPPGRSGRCPGRKHGDRDAAVAAGGTTARSVAARERGKSGKRERRSRPHQELVGVARCGQGGPRRPENRRGRERRAAGGGPRTGEHESLDPEPPSMRATVVEEAGLGTVLLVSSVRRGVDRVGGNRDGSGGGWPAEAGRKWTAASIRATPALFLARGGRRGRGKASYRLRSTRGGPERQQRAR